jgi:predicted transcriptional regulator
MPLKSNNKALQKARQQRKLTKSQRKQMALELHKNQPDMSLSEVAERVGVSTTTVKNYYKEMGIDTNKESLLSKYSAN